VATRESNPARRHRLALIASGGCGMRGTDALRRGCAPAGLVEPRLVGIAAGFTIAFPIARGVPAVADFSGLALPD